MGVLLTRPARRACRFCFVRPRERERPKRPRGQIRSVMSTVHILSDHKCLFYCIFYFFFFLCRRARTDRGLLERRWGSTWNICYSGVFCARYLWSGVEWWMCFCACLQRTRGRFFQALTASFSPG